MVEAWYLKSYYLGQDEIRDVDHQNQDPVLVQPDAQQPPSRSESGTVEPIPLPNIRRAGRPGAPVYSTYVDQRPVPGNVQSSYLTQEPKSQTKAKPSNPSSKIDHKQFAPVENQSHFGRQKEIDAKNRINDGKDAKEQESKEQKTEVTNDVKAESAGNNSAGPQLKPKDKRSAGSSPNSERNEKKNVQIELGKVVFSSPYDRQQIVDITLKNVCGQIVHYKVMATQPKFYRVKNKQNVIMPGQSAVAAVRLGILKNAAKSKKENHRIIIQTAVSKKAQEDKKFWRDIDGKKNRVQFSRLPVKLLLEGEQEANEDHNVEYDNGQPFIVEPESELIFRGPFDEPVTSTIYAINNTDKFMFVKVLITNPASFRVCPNVCTISPRSMQIFAAILRPIGAKELEKLQKKKNKFMLEYAESEKNDQDAETFFHKHPKSVHQIKMKGIVESEESSPVYMSDTDGESSEDEDEDSEGPMGEGQGGGDTEESESEDGSGNGSGEDEENRGPRPNSSHHNEEGSGRSQLTEAQRAREAEREAEEVAEADRLLFEPEQFDITGPSPYCLHCRRRTRPVVIPCFGCHRLRLCQICSSLSPNQLENMPSCRPCNLTFKDLLIRHIESLSHPNKENRPQQHRH